ncbi:MAG TPA: plastocyanin/azurin family copper-binding protein [Thermoleophilaceae bacterium]
MRRPISLLTFSLTLLTAGCGSSGGGTGTTAPPQAADSNGGTPAGGVTKVSMHNIQFNPKTVTVKTGSTVEWVNDDSVSHDVTKTLGPGPKFQSGTGDLASGDTYKVTFHTAGTVKYECTVHPGMTGTVVVK